MQPQYVVVYEDRVVPFLSENEFTLPLATYGPFESREKTETFLRDQGARECSGQEDVFENEDGRYTVTCLFSPEQLDTSEGG